MKKQLFLMTASVLLALSLSGCNQANNERIKELYGKGEVETVVNASERESFVGEQLENEAQQSSQAQENVEEIYDIYSDKTDKEFYGGLDSAMNPGERGESWSKRLLRGFYSVYSVIRAWAPVICIISIFMGLLVFLLSKYNKGARRFGLYVLVIGIPALVIFIVFGVGILNDVFFY